MSRPRISLTIMKRAQLTFVLVASGYLLSGTAAAVVSAGRPLENRASVPANFEANRGQVDDRVLFRSVGPDHQAFFTSTETVVVVGAPGSKAAPSVLRLRPLDANPTPRVVGVDEQPTRVHYFIGDDERRWQAKVPTYERLAYRQIYPGVDLIYYRKGGELEWDFLVAPGADPNAILLEIEGTARLRLDAAGHLVGDSAGRSIRFQRPEVYQNIDGVRRSIPGAYVLQPSASSTERGRKVARVSFSVGAYDRARPLVIDPVLVYSTLLGGGWPDFGHAIAVDGGGNAYIVGQTRSFTFPTSGATGMPGESYSAFVTKLNAAGTGIVYSTFLGGTGAVDAFDQMDVAVDAAGNVYVTGETDATDFPTTGGIQPAHAGGYDAFVTKLNPEGDALVYSTYLGGDNDDFGRGISVSSGGDAYVIGITRSPDFPTVAALQPAYAGLHEAFVARLDPTGSALVYSTYLGGTGDDIGYDIATDALGNAYVTGYVGSSDFPTANALQPSLAGGIHDAFVAKLTPDGSQLVYSTYLGGSKEEEGLGIAVDASGCAHVVGWSDSLDFPTENPVQQANAGGFDAFAAKLRPDGSALLYSTYLGGSETDYHYDVALDAAGSAYLAGTTGSPDFPVVDAWQAASGGGFDAFAARLDPTGSVLLYSSYLGGSGDENPGAVGFGIAVDPAGSAYVAGTTPAADFPVVNSQQPHAGSLDVFVAKIGAAEPDPDLPQITVTVVADAGAAVLSVTLTNAGPSRPVEVKLWVDSPQAGIVSLLPEPSPVLNLESGPPLSLVSEVPIPSGLVVPGARVHGALLDPATGNILSESTCHSAPCNWPL